MRAALLDRPWSRSVVVVVGFDRRGGRNCLGGIHVARVRVPTPAEGWTASRTMERAMDTLAEADRRGLTLTSTTSNKRRMWKWSGDPDLRSPWFFSKGTALAWLEDEIERGKAQRGPVNSEQ